MLIYTGAGKEGDQTASGVNARIAQQRNSLFPIYGFVQIAGRRDSSIGNKRWAFLGLLQYARSFREKQIDSRGEWRNVFVFELLIHSEPSVIQKDFDSQQMSEIVARHPLDEPSDDGEVVTPSSIAVVTCDLSHIEPIRRKLLAFEPRQFEHVIENLLAQSGFDQIEVTRYSQDGGIDLNARPGVRSWPIRNLLIQVQAKRWLHTVGRKDVAELRGSLQPHAAGCIVTTSHFSRAALTESSAPGKVPILAIDGYELANIIATLNLQIT